MLGDSQTSPWGVCLCQGTARAGGSPWKSKGTEGDSVCGQDRDHSRNSWVSCERRPCMEVCALERINTGSSNHDNVQLSYQVLTAEA